MNELKRLLPWLLVVVAAGAFAVHVKSVRQLRSDLEELRNQFASPAPSGEDETSSPSSTFTRRVMVRDDFPAEQRLAKVERAVAELVLAAEHLMERGAVPPGERMLADLRSRFADVTKSDRDRLQALQMLRRNGAMTDEVALQAAAWLQTATNAGTQRALLQQLDGATNTALRQPLLGMASAEDSRVREEAVDALSSFAGDPQVDEMLWDLATNDPDEDVREEAADVLRDGPISEARLADLKTRALDSQASLADRLTALRFLQGADADTSAVTASLAQMAQDVTDPALRRELFRAFDRMDDPAVKLPLVYGLQDQNPLVREEAVDALADFRSDPAVEQWLQYVSQNDPDPQVRREAFEAMMDDD